MWDLFMYAGLGLVGYMMYCMLNDKPLIPWISKRKKTKPINKDKGFATKELEISFKELLGIKAMHGNLYELVEQNETRTFVGLIKLDNINYLLKSYNEQVTTDNSYEHLLASLSLGPGREVNIGLHTSSRPIDLSDEMKPYREAFPNLDPIAQRYAESMFFPFMEQWQNSVDEFDYQNYFEVILSYPLKMIDGLDEESVLIKVRNEFARLSNSIISNYSRMGGYSHACNEYELYEALYFATNKKTGSLGHFRKLMSTEGVLSPFVSMLLRFSISFETS